MIKKLFFIMASLYMSMAAMAYTLTVGEDLRLDVPSSPDGKKPDLYDVRWAVLGNSRCVTLMTSTSNPTYVRATAAGTVKISCCARYYNRSKWTDPMYSGYISRTTYYDITCVDNTGGGGGSEPSPGNDNIPNVTPDPSINNGDYFYVKTEEGQSMYFCKIALENENVASVMPNCIRSANGRVTIPSYVKGYPVRFISNESFENLSGLTELVIPHTVTWVDDHIALNCDNLRTIICESPIPPQSYYSNPIIFSLAGMSTLYVPKGSKSAYEVAPGWKYFRTIKEIGEDESSESDIKIDEEHFPDANFRKYLLEQDYGKDGKITSDEISKITYIGVSKKEISSLKGIEIFTALKGLECSYNQLSSLDISKNTALRSLSCDNNQLSFLDVSKNTALEWLNCYENQLSSLDVSKNTALTEMNCSLNQLSSLDISKNTALTKLVCCSNQLLSLDVSKNTKLTSLYCYGNRLSSLDVSKNTVLKELECQRNQLSSLDVSKITALTDLKCYSNRLSSLDVSKNTVLKRLDCSNNQLSSLDVSKNTALIVLYCYVNQLSSLDVSKNTALSSLLCYNNQLSSLEVSRNMALTRLDCYRNNIKGEAMDKLIQELPRNYSTTEYKFCVVDKFSSGSEGNVCTTTQVAAAKAKGWTPYNSLIEYKGSDPSSIVNLQTESDKNAPIYNLSGNRLSKPRKGINIIGGKKVVVK